jgi:processive 1,2-diacylglycerol beta-glucosyltransferase
VADKLTSQYGRPDIIISIQPEVNAAARLFKIWFSIPFHTIIIDLAIHGLWINRYIDRYYVANEPLKDDLIEYDVPEHKIIVSGMPLRSGFSKLVGSRVKAVRKRLGFVEDMKTVLLVGGLLGKMFDFPGAIKSIMDTEMPVQIAAVFGRNEVDRRKVQALKSIYRWPMHLFGTVSNMDDLMWASDVVISKPGSVTMAEALSLGKPMIVMNPLAGSAQELRFAGFLEENGAGLWTRSVQELGSALRRMTGNSREYLQMCSRARELGQCSLTANDTIFNDIKQTVGSREDL